MSDSSRSWCVTVFNDDWVKPSEEQVKYLVVGVEVCPKTGVSHKQIYLELWKKSRMTAVKKILQSKTCHCEFRKGTRDEARNYCIKDGDYEEIGVTWVAGIDQTNNRSDLLTKKAMIDAGCSELDLWEEDFEGMTAHYKAMREYKLLREKQNAKRPKVHVEVFTGASGSGKSHFASKDYPDAYVVSKGNNGNMWFDGYDGEDTIILDDFRGNWCTYEMLLKYLDKYKLRIEVKGGSRWAQWTKVIITSVEHPSQWYRCYDYQLERRISAVKTIQPGKYGCCMRPCPKVRGNTIPAPYDEILSDSE